MFVVYNACGLYIISCFWKGAMGHGKNLHLKFMRSLFEFKERVLNIAGSTTINNF